MLPARTTRSAVTGTTAEGAEAMGAGAGALRMGTKFVCAAAAPASRPRQAAQTAAIEASGVHTHTVADSHVLLGRASARLVSALLLEALGTRDVAELRRATVDMDEMELELRD